MTRSAVAGSEMSPATVTTAGSRNQAFQANAAAHATSAAAELPKIPVKQVSASTWAWGAAETLVVIAVMIAGYRGSCSGWPQPASPEPARARRGRHAMVPGSAHRRMRRPSLPSSRARRPRAP